MVTHLPEKFAKVGKRLRFKVEGDGWDVFSVGSDRIPEERLPDAHDAIKAHRKRTGDAERA